MESAISLRDVGIRFRMHRRGSRGKRVPRLVGRRQRFWGIRQVSLEIAHGEVVGLLGPNGSGKTTLLRLVSGIYVPDQGEAIVRGRVSPLLSATAGLEVGLSGWENIELSGVMLGLTRRQAQAIAPAVAEFAGLGEFMDAPVRVYSSGMRARLGFAIAAYSDPDILALDEVISVGDHEFREKSAVKVRELIEHGRTALIATHDVSTIVEVCDRLVRLERGRVVDQGEPQEVADRYIEDHGGRLPARGDVFRGVRAARRARRA